MKHDSEAVNAVRQTPNVPLWLLVLFAFAGTLGIHIFVPALPFAAASLPASNASVQLTISLYMAGLAIGQLIYGPVSDRFGRRPTLMVGLALYTVAGFGAALAPDIDSLVLARFLQALGGCAGVVLGRAIVRDTVATQEAARRLALINLVVIIGPGLAPIVGTALTLTLGWRFILYALSAFGVVTLLCTWRLLPETGPTAAGASLSATLLARNYWQLLKSPAFLGYAIGGGCSTSTVFAFIAMAPFIFVHQLGRPAHEVGIYLAILVSGGWLGSMLVSRLIHKVGSRVLLVAANGLCVLGAFVLLLLAASQHLSVALVMLSMFAFTVGAGVASPAALAEAISVNPRVTGSASGLYGFTQMTIGALCTAIASLGDDPALTTAVVLASAAVIAQLAFWLASANRRG